MIEMMISIAIGLMIIAALVGVLTSSASSSKTNDTTSELQSNGRYALNHLQRELHHAGYRGYLAAKPSSAAWTTGAIANECQFTGDPANSFVKNIRQGVWGHNDNTTNPFAGNCLPNTKFDTSINSDILVIRRAAVMPTLAASAVAASYYLHSAYDSLTLQNGSSLPVSNNTGAENFALQVYVYYIGKDDNDATIPALRRVTLVGASMQDEMVVSGIEQMQFEYGITTKSGTVESTQYFTADNIAGTPGATGATAWDSVNSVRIWLLARNAKQEAGYQNSQTYAMSATNYPVVDGFRRQLFNTVVQLRNFRD